MTIEKTLGLGAIVLMTLAFLLTASPEPSFAFHDTDTVGSRLLAIRRRHSRYEVVLAGVHVILQ